MKPYPYYPTRPVSCIRDVVDYPAKHTPDKDAFRVRTDKSHYKAVSWKQFQKEIQSLGSALYAKELKEDAPICVVGENLYEWVLVYMTVLCGNGTIVPLDKDLPIDELREQIELVGAKAVFFSKTYESRMLELSQSSDSDILFVSLNGAETFAQTLDSLIKEGTGLLDRGYADYANTPIDTEKTAAIYFTSGTGGKSKGVMLSQKNIIASFDGACKHVNYTEDDVMLSVLPLHHAYESNCGILAMLHTSTVICFNENLKYFLDNMKLFSPTGMCIVPMFAETMYKLIIESAKRSGKLKKLNTGRKLSRFLKKFGIDITDKLFAEVYTPLGGRFKKATVGGAPMDPEITRFFRDIGIVMVQGYGITECSPLVAVNREKYYNDASVGPHLPECDVKIKDDEILVKGDNVMIGYYGDQEQTDAAFEDGWFKTGDLGYFDDRGFLFITGRKKNLIILSNGENISPEELELKISRIPYVKENVVYALRGAIAAEILPDIEQAKKDNGRNAKESIEAEIARMNAALPTYKQIKTILYRDEEFEKTTTRKIKRYKLNRKEEQ